MKLRLRDQKENIVYLLLWLVLFLAPVINMLVGSYIGNRTGVDWYQVLHLWQTYLVYFMRIHRSYIVNLQKIQEVNKNRVVLDADTYLPIGDLYREAFNAYVGRHFLGKQ